MNHVKIIEIQIANAKTHYIHFRISILISYFVFEFVHTQQKVVFNDNKYKYFLCMYLLILDC